MASILYFFVFIFCILLQVFGQELSNVTIDDNNSAIRYIGNWNLSAWNVLDEGGYHMLTDDPNAVAIFEFTGVAVFFLSPRWPYDVTTQVQLDSSPPEVLSLRDLDTPKSDGGGESVGSHIIWGVEDLANQSHQLRISVAAGQQWAIVDGLVFTTVNQSATPTGTVSRATSDTWTSTLSNIPVTSSTSSPSAPSHRTGESFRMLTIGLGVGIGFLVLTVLSLAIYSIWYRRTRRLRYRKRSLDLEKHFPPVPKQLSGFPSPSSTASFGDSYILSPVDLAPQRLHATPPFTSRQSQSDPPAHSVGLDIRQSILEGPPPSYYDSMGPSHQFRASRWDSRHSDSAPRGLHTQPQAPSNMMADSQGMPPTFSLLAMRCK
ncbi:hypothetical protein P691DRAFT_244559 [Macrolepiota fuliginosa MF-IS2]|uniref:Uncharacterized protein n=1 Tax=Macrolepiota fuliginosa MF-IS2 TaxID=1400762 RepID=A0A9P6C1Z2_9AGAR|nr:hypothetical protein P691DRAFT_244559 [Macrolepiota fuliginosa MF-IS2]